MEKKIKISGSLLKFTKNFCKGNSVTIDNTKFSFPESISFDVWYDFDIFKNAINEIENQKGYTFIDKLGKEYFYYLAETEGFKEVFYEYLPFEKIISGMYKIYQLFIKAERIGIWKTEEVSTSGFLRVKDNTIMPPLFTKGFLFSTAKACKLNVIKVKLVSEIKENDEALNVYEIIWMKKLKTLND